jgi:hypothetical protein
MKAIDLITLEEAKAHLSIDTGYNGDDALIEDKLETAFAIVLSEASQTAEALLDSDGKLDRIARAATLLKLGDLYAYREDHYNGSVSAIGDYQRLISLIRNYT